MHLIEQVEMRNWLFEVQRPNPLYIWSRIAASAKNVGAVLGVFLRGYWV